MATIATRLKGFINNARQVIIQLLKRLWIHGKRYDLADPKTVDLIRNKGERATHLHPNDNYVAHLSIYDFATRFCQGLNVLDAGSGSGYGSAYLAEKGAKRVVGIELDQDAVQFSKQTFKRISNLAYKQMSLERIHGFKLNEFDVIFSSNVLEHVSDVHTFFWDAVRILKPSAKLILAVPPIQDEQDIGHIIANLNNPYHVNIWTIRQWLHTLQQYFQEITPYSHNFVGKDTFNSVNDPQDSKITLADFKFVENPDLSATSSNLTAIFIAGQPKKQLKNINKGLIDHSFTVNPPGDVKYDDRGVLCSDVIYSTQTHVDHLRIGIKFCQTFVCNHHNLSGIALSIATYRRRIDSTLKFTLLDDQKETIREVQQNTLDIPDNSFYPFLFDPILESKGKLFTFCIETIADKGDTITLWTDNTIRNACTRNGSPANIGLLYKCCFR